VPLHLMAGSKEDAETVTAFFQDTRGGRGDPLRVVSDGAPGGIKAIKIAFHPNTDQPLAPSRAVEQVRAALGGSERPGVPRDRPAALDAAPGGGGGRGAADGDSLDLACTLLRLPPDHGAPAAGRLAVWWTPSGSSGSGGARAPAPAPGGPSVSQPQEAMV
jgi:hypothetical protein